MTARRRLRHGFCVLALCQMGAACGQKGPPLPPLRLVPAAIEDLSARRLGSTVRLQFTVPLRNQDGSTPADLARVDVYGLTDGPAAIQPGLLGDADLFMKRGTLVARLEIQPPPGPEQEAQKEAGPAGPASVPVDDPRPAQGQKVTVLERLTPELTTPRQSTPDSASAADEPAGEGSIFPPLWPAPDDGPQRVYVAVGISRRDRPGTASARATVPLTGPPAPPALPTLRYTASTVTIEWSPPPGIGAAVQSPPTADLLPSTPIGPGPIERLYNVYEVAAELATPDPVQPPLNPQPLAVLSFEDPRVAFGVVRCYAVRTVRVWGALAMESDASERACVTLRDTFAPDAPQGLAAVGSEGAISLIWEPNLESDLAGYVILRGEAPGETLQALTPVPIAETTYRDTAVTPGVRYVYAVVAVDGAAPPNRSPESNRVEESAR